MKPTDPASSKETLVLPDVLIGKTVGAYRVTGLLGKGGMGVVYRAHDESLDRDVALKILPPALSLDRDYAERFLREAKMAAKIDHPRIVPVYAAGAGEHGAWIAMQLVRGRTLHEELHDGMRPTFAQAVKLTRQMAEALGAAHAAGLIHRDIKPANVIVDAAGDAKVLDFGLARPTLPTGQTQDGTYLGTPEYSSPEQCQSNDIDHRADLYSLGVVMYEMLGGRIPHVAETPLNLFHKILNEEPLPLRDLNPRVPPSLAAIVVRLMAKNRDARYPDAASVIADLDKVQVREDRAGRGETVVFGPADRARVAAWTLAGVLASVLVAAVVHVGPWTGRAGSGTRSQDTAPPIGGTETRPPAKLRGRVVFLDFKNLTGEAEVGWMASGVPELICYGMAESGGLDPVDRDSVIEAMRREFNARLTSGGSDSVSALQDQGLRLLRALDADVLVRGSYYAQGDVVRVHAMAYGLRDGVLELLGTTKEEGSSKALLAVADRTASRLTGLVHPDADREKEELALQGPGATKAGMGRLDGLVVRLDRRRSLREEWKAETAAPAEKDPEALRKQREESPDLSGAAGGRPAPGNEPARHNDRTEAGKGGTGKDPAKKELKAGEVPTDKNKDGRPADAAANNDPPAAPSEGGETVVQTNGPEADDETSNELIGLLKELAARRRIVEKDLPVVEMGGLEAVK
ncbi:MAG: serine/threonine protein kinase [Candidatus Brocadiae bacterium]|nr:serine/threonine protein kinase [Candidatus Brocadiia bacterium]